MKLIGKSDQKMVRLEMQEFLCWSWRGNYVRVAYNVQNKQYKLLPTGERVDTITGEVWSEQSEKERALDGALYSSL